MDILSLLIWLAILAVTPFLIWSNWKTLNRRLGVLFLYVSVGVFCSVSLGCYLFGASFSLALLIAFHVVGLLNLIGLVALRK
jgi:FtsH-binding integral membrane protein